MKVYIVIQHKFRSYDSLIISVHKSCEDALNAVRKLEKSIHLDSYTILDKEVEGVV